MMSRRCSQLEQLGVLAVGLALAACSERQTLAPRGSDLAPAPHLPGTAIPATGHAGVIPAGPGLGVLSLQSTTIDFEAVSGAVTAQYAALGVTFSGATVLTQNVNLNPPFPPHSGVKVVFDDPGAVNPGVISVNFSPAVSSVSGYVTGNTVITLRCYDTVNASLGSSALPARNYIGAGTGVNPNYLLSVTAAGITRCTFSDSGNTFTVDDLSFSRDVNDPPTVTAPANGAVLTVRSNHNLTFVVSGQDPNAGDVVTLSASGLPTGATLASVASANPVQTAFGWTPSAADAGAHPITFTATDGGGLTATSTVTVNVVGVINVSVLLNGQPVSGRVATAVNSMFGPFLDDGVTLSTALTNAGGSAVIGGLRVPGDYCVHVRPLTALLDASANNTLQVPAVNFVPTQAGAEPGAITGPTGSDAFTVQNYVADCITAPVIHLTNLNGNASVTLNVPVASSTAQVQFLDLQGNSSGQPGWVILDANDQIIPWSPANLSAQGLKKGLLVSAAPAQLDGTVNLTGLPPGTPVVIESGVNGDPQQGALTSTVRLTSGGAGQSLLLPPIVLEPLLCTLQKKDEQTGDNSPRKIDFLGPVKDGFRANPGVPLTRRNEIAIFYSQSGTGDSRLQMRVFVGATEFSLTARYTWDGTTGARTALIGTGADAGIMAQPFFARLPDGKVRVTWTIGNLPAGVSRAEYMLVTAGDNFPDSPRNLQSSGFSPISIPTVCTGGQGNDDQWWVGD